MKIEVGKKYHARNGEVVTIIAHQDGQWPWVGITKGGLTRSYTDEGAFYTKDALHPQNIVAEVASEKWVVTATTPFDSREEAEAYAKKSVLATNHTIFIAAVKAKAIYIPPAPALGTVEVVPYP